MSLNRVKARICLGEFKVKKIRIICADDAETHRSLLKSNLRMASRELGVEFEIIAEVENGADLISCYQNQAPGTVDAIFSDIRMPNVDGLSSLITLRKIDPKQKIIMVSSESINSMESANAVHGEQARKTLEIEQRMTLLEKVRERIIKGITEDGKTNSILIGCEKLALDPIFVAKKFGANGYLRKPYAPDKTKEIIKKILIENVTTFIALE